MSRPSLRLHLTVLVTYVLLASVFTYPILFHISDKVAGRDDVWLYLWDLWWGKQSMIGLNSNLFYTDYLFYPTGLSLAFRSLTPLNMLLSLPMQYFFTLTETYNLLVLLSFIMAGYTSFLLAHYLIEDSWAAFISSLIYAFSPMHFTEVVAGHLNLLSTQWLPLYILCLFKLLKEEKRMNIVYAAVSFLLVSLGEWQYMGFAALFTLIFILYYWYNRALDISSFKAKFMPVILLAGAMLLPILYPMFVETIRGGYMQTPIQASIYYSLDLLSPIMPNPHSPLFAGYTKLFGTLKTSDGYGEVLPVGYVSLILVLYYLFDKKRFSDWLRNKKNTLIMLHPTWGLMLILFTITSFTILAYLTSTTFFDVAVVCTAILLSMKILNSITGRTIQFWTLNLIIFFVLALGPILHIAGKLSIPLPYVLLYPLPLFGIFRAPVRFMILVVLSVSILSGYGFKALVGRFRRRNFAAAFVSALILFEFLAVPVYMSDIGVPEVYQNLSLDDGDYAILEVPVPPLYIPYGSATFIWGINEFEYYQTVHNKRVIGGYCDRIPSTAMDVLRKDPLFTVFNTPPFNATLSSDEALITLKKYDIRYVLVHRTLFRNQVYTNETYLQKINDLMLNISKPVYDDGDIIAYEIT